MRIGNDLKEGTCLLDPSKHLKALSPLSKLLAGEPNEKIVAKYLKYHFLSFLDCFRAF